MAQHLYGLIGFPLGHSFSKGYFTEKFERLGIAASHVYEKFELESIEDFTRLIATQKEFLKGLNVTIPHKKSIIPFLNSLDSSAERVGAVNVIKFLADGKLVGYNSDYYGFKKSLEDWLPISFSSKALILGNGGAARAVQVALDDLEIDWKIVSRKATTNELHYEDLTQEVLQTHHLIINSSPIGTFPHVDDCPDIPYQYLSPQHFLYDLVYNPAETQFMQKGALQGAKTHNGLPMLHLQAERAWEIWNL